MNQTVTLLNEWASFEAGNPKATIDDFCRFRLLNNENQQRGKRFLGGNVPPDAYSILAKMIGRVAKLHATYAVIAVKDCGLSSIDEFLYLNSIAHSASPNKTTIIASNFNELSSGLLILERLIALGLISEEIDQADKRTRRLSLTRNGNRVLQQCYKNMLTINKIFFEGLSQHEIALSVRLLTPLEAAFATRWKTDKGRTFAEIKEDK